MWRTRRWYCAEEDRAFVTGTSVKGPKGDSVDDWSNRAGWICTNGYDPMVSDEPNRTQGKRCVSGIQRSLTSS